MNQLLRITLGLAALLGFLLSLLVHIEALKGIDIGASVPYVSWLHAGMFLVFGPFVLISRKELGEDISLVDMAKRLPPWVGLLSIAIFIYVVLNFLLFMYHGVEADAVLKDGKYFLASHGRPIRELTAAESTAFKANELRGISGHWLIFYFVPAAYFLFDAGRREAVTRLQA